MDWFVTKVTNSVSQSLNLSLISTRDKLWKKANLFDSTTPYVIGSLMGILRKLGALSMLAPTLVTMVPLYMNKV